MIKAIVTTTINPPTKAIKLFAKRKDWSLIIAGDLSTPHELFRKLEKEHKNVVYLSPDDQDKKYPKLSKAIGWKKIQRRNIGYVEAYSMGAEVIASVDDDNIPYENWGESIRINKPITVNYYQEKNPAFDPIGATSERSLWHRGFPLQLIAARAYNSKTKQKKVFDIQANFWDGDPDIDAIGRMIYMPEVKFSKSPFPMASNKMSPFNSQNTFFSREVMRDYFLFPDIGRMDDIWAGYYVQAKGYKVFYDVATVYQARNVHDLTKDMKGETLGYENNLELIKKLKSGSDAIFEFLPTSAIKAFEAYQKLF